MFLWKPFQTWRSLTGGASEVTYFNLKFFFLYICFSPCLFSNIFWLESSGVNLWATLSMLCYLVYLYLSLSLFLHASRVVLPFGFARSTFLTSRFPLSSHSHTYTARLLFVVFDRVSSAAPFLPLVPRRQAPRSHISPGELTLLSFGDSPYTH